MKTKTSKTTQRHIKPYQRAISRFTEGVKTGLWWLKKIKNK